MSNMLIGYFFDNRLLISTKDSSFLLLFTYVRTFDCLEITGQRYLPWLSGPETKNLSFPLSVLYSLVMPAQSYGRHILPESRFTSIKNVNFRNSLLWPKLCWFTVRGEFHANIFFCINLYFKLLLCHQKLQNSEF